MRYFITGATGFIGRNLLERLLARDGDHTIYVLTRDGSEGKVADLADRLGAPDGVIVPVSGDLVKGRLGIVDATTTELNGTIDHVFHLAAVYDLTASAHEQHAANIEGTRHALELAEAVGAGCFHHVSSIAVAGRFDGVFREDMFAEATDLDSNPYFRTKHESEKLVREFTGTPTRIYRPAIVVGDSRTGEIDKIDGPYYFFKLIQRIRRTLPQWMPMVGVEGSPINMVPVDYVADALDHLAHADGHDGKVFALVDPNPPTVGQAMNLFAVAAHAPKFSLRFDPKMAAFIPKSARSALTSMPPVKRVVDNALDGAHLPREVLTYIRYPTSFDDRITQAALEGTGIAPPPLEDYAWRLWDYWERHLDPDLFKDYSLAGAIEGKRVMITGASAGIGREAALRVGEAGGIVLLVARTASKLEEVRAEIAELGGTAHVHAADLSSVDDIDRMAAEVISAHGGVDILVNNAGRSIRRSVKLSYDRFHDYERTMELNYFGPVKLILALLPGMRERRFGHIINISSIGVQTNTPRFSAYIASKSALDSFSRAVASEVIGSNVHFTTIHMPLVRTAMIAPTRIYDAFPTKSPEEAGEMITGAMIRRPKRVATRLGTFGQLAYAVSPKTVDVLLHQAYKLFPDSTAAKGKLPEVTAGDQATDGTAPVATVADNDDGGDASDAEVSNEALAFAHIMRGIHW